MIFADYQEIKFRRENGISLINDYDPKNVKLYSFVEVIELSADRYNYDNDSDKLFYVTNDLKGYARFGINSTLQTIIFHNLTLIRKIIKFISQSTLIIAKKTSILRNILSNLYKILRFFFKFFIMTMLSYLSILFLIQIYDVMYTYYSALSGKEPYVIQAEPGRYNFGDYIIDSVTVYVSRSGLFAATVIITDNTIGDIPTIIIIIDVPNAFL